jgi:5'-deoxynucleotidase YfbR-like HD superfamily hydrolase
MKLLTTVYYIIFSFICVSVFAVELIEERKCASNEEIVRERITKLQEIWEKLTKQSQSKSRYLMESNQLQQYNNNVKELDYWLGEVGLSFVQNSRLAKLNPANQ